MFPLPAWSSYLAALLNQVYIHLKYHIFCYFRELIMKMDYRKRRIIALLWIVSQRSFVLGYIHELLCRKPNGFCWKNQAVHQHSLRSRMGQKRQPPSFKLAVSWQHRAQRFAGYMPTRYIKTKVAKTKVTHVLTFRCAFSEIHESSWMFAFGNRLGTVQTRL